MDPRRGSPFRGRGSKQVCRARPFAGGVRQTCLGVRLRGNRDQLLGLAGRIAERIEPIFPRFDDDRMLSYDFMVPEAAFCDPAWVDGLRLAYPYLLPVA